MRPIFPLAVVFTLFAGPAMADRVCQPVEPHRPAANVAYQPGVDVNGNAVVPADLNSGAAALPEIVRIPLTVPLADFVNPTPAFLDGVEVEIGAITVNRLTGETSYDDQTLTPRHVVLCRDPATGAIFQLVAPPPPPPRPG